MKKLTAREWHYYNSGAFDKRNGRERSDAYMLPKHRELYDKGYDKVNVGDPPPQTTTSQFFKHVRGY